MLIKTVLKNSFSLKFQKGNVKTFLAALKNFFAVKKLQRERGEIQRGETYAKKFFNATSKRIHILLR